MRKVALLRIVDNQWQVKWPCREMFDNLTGWFGTKTLEQTITKLSSFELNKGLEYKFIEEGKND